jgi:hypothetical protein
MNFLLFHDAGKQPFPLVENLNLRLQVRKEKLRKWESHHSSGILNSCCNPLRSSTAPFHIKANIRLLARIDLVLELMVKIVK